MSSSSFDIHEKLISDFLREIRQFNSLGAFFFRAAAAQLGMNATDLQVIDILEITGPSTAGQLAELTGLTTGAITGMIDRLEKSGFVRRESDPNDGRRVLVRLKPNETAMKEIAPLFDAIGQRWDDVASKYNDEQISFLIEFLSATNNASKEEISHLRTASKGAQKNFTAALEGITSGRLVFSSGAAMVHIRGDDSIPDLYQTHFEGTPPEVKYEQGVVTIRNRKRLWLLGWGNQAIKVLLNTSIPWRIEIRGGAAGVSADLTTIELIELTANYGASSVDLKLPAPSTTVPVQISGGASSVTILRPKNVPARVRFRGWTSEIDFDNERQGDMRNDLQLQNADYEDAIGRYDIEFSGNASEVRIGQMDSPSDSL